MKRFKKLAGIVLALVMVMALAVPAFAAAGPNGDPSVLEDTTNQTGTITVTPLRAVKNSPFRMPTSWLTRPWTACLMRRAA